MFHFALFLAQNTHISQPKGRHSDLSYPNTSLVWKRCSPYGTIPSNPNSTNNLAPSVGHHIMSVPRQKLFFERAKIRIISHSTKHLQKKSIRFGKDRGDRDNGDNSGAPAVFYRVKTAKNSEISPRVNFSTIIIYTT